MSAAELNRLTATAAARKIASGEITSEALVQACLDRIGTREPAVRAWAFLDPELALVQARKRDRAKDPGGPLHGVPVGVKDVIDTADMPTEYNAPMYRGHRPARDADCVARARAAGAVILGKTVTTQFAFMVPAQTRNPHRPGHTPGGSSSGSAAAVGDFMVPLALGTQTGGSTIRPAAYCGTFGFKGSYNRMSVAGIKPLALSFDTVGLLARSAEDLALFDTVLADGSGSGAGGTDMPDRASGRLRIGYCETPFWAKAEESSRQALAAASAALRSADVMVSDAVLPVSFADLADANTQIIAAEAATYLGREYRESRQGLEPGLRKLIEDGLAMAPRTLQAARDALVRCATETDRLFDRYDALLTPSAPGEAPAGLETIGDPVFNRAWTSIYLPCVTIPSATGPNGMPVGVQLVGRHGEDRKLLAIAQRVSGMLLA